MQHKIPAISEVNLELRDLDYYHDGASALKNIEADLDVKAIFNTDNEIVFFIHLRYTLKLEEKSQSVFHTDYLSFVECSDVDWTEKDAIKFDKKHLAHLLGMSFLMVRGAISQRLASNMLSEIELPFINPVKMLEKNLESIEDEFILTKEFTPHEGNEKA